MLLVAYVLLMVATGVAMPSEPQSVIPALVEAPSLGVVSVIQGRSSISGHVFDNSRRPVGQLFVELLDEYDHPIASPVRTNDSGFYTFNGLLPGIYQVKLQAYGTNYVEQTKRVEIIALGRNQSGGLPLQVDFTLRIKRDSASKDQVNSGTVFAQDVPEPARRAYAEAAKLLDGGKDVGQGIAALKRAIDIFPRYFMALERLGIEYAKRQQYEPASSVLNKAVAINSHADQSLYWLGISQYKLGQTSAAIETLRRAVAASPGSINAYMGLGTALYADGKYDEAETNFKQAYKSGGRRVPVVHMYLAQLYSKTKHYRKAADELELFLKEEPNARDEGKIREAIEDLRKKAKQGI